jgi:hypothetical protein
MVYGAWVLWMGLIGAALARMIHNVRHLRRLDSGYEARADVSVIIPARNEAAAIADCVRSFANQTLAPAQIVVVDDGSTDGTGDILTRLATSLPRLETRPAPQPPPGWLGKPAACWHGAEAAHGAWLLFADADTVARPSLIASLIACAEAHHIDLLSLQPIQTLRSLPEAVILPAGALTFGLLQDVAHLNAGEVAVANGQCLLIRAETYRAVGGHAHPAVRGRILEDLALARVVRAAGGHVEIRDGGEAISTRMYRSGAALWEGVTKMAAELYGDGSLARASALSVLLLVVAVASVAFPIWAVQQWFAAPGLVTTLLAVAALLPSLILLVAHVGLSRTVLRAPLWTTLLYPFGYLLAGVAGLVSVYRHATGTVIWRGRRIVEPQFKASTGSKLG